EKAALLEHVADAPAIFRNEYSLLGIDQHGAVEHDPPAVGRTMPAIILTNVGLPEPERPKNALSRPSETKRATGRNHPNRRVTPPGRLMRATFDGRHSAPATPIRPLPPSRLRWIRASATSRLLRRLESA